ncbi:hypothetical protein C8T65DRAFT_580128 [Cerioporus squamosus]|nr:hypothetical protein C8T65DRAFT_580128 [Cerioporus squamosus]
MRGILRLVPNVTDLTLMLLKSTPPDIFFLVFFPNLQLFKTNLPHAKVKQFIALHTSLTIIVLGPCGHEGRCALSDTDLGRVATVECSARCLEAVVRKKLVHLAVENNSTAICVPLIFRQLRTRMSELYSLTLDIFPADMDILVSIALVAPMVRKLKLIEKLIHVGRRISSRCAFNDYLTWHRCLRKLTCLEEFALRTLTPLVRTCGDYALERRMIIGWVYGVRSRGATPLHRVKSHPSLYHISVWYGRTLSSATLSKWFKDAGQWVRLADPITGAHLGDIDF